MNIFEFIKRSLGEEVEYEFDACGNCYIYSESYQMADAEYLFETNSIEAFILLEKKQAERLMECEIIVPDEFMEYECLARRPYYRMRGKPVTEEQAMDIIRRTDNFFSWDMRDGMPKDYIGGMNFDNWLISKNHYPFGYGWIHKDGTVGCNAITQKYPDVYEFVIEWMKKLVAFPCMITRLKY